MFADVGSSWEKEAKRFASVALRTLSDSFQCFHPKPIALRSERQTLPARLVAHHQQLVVMSPVGGFRWIYDFAELRRSPVVCHMYSKCPPIFKVESAETKLGPYHYTKKIILLRSQLISRLGAYKKTTYCTASTT